MKTSFYKKSCRWLVMLVAMFAVNLSGMAQETKTFTLPTDETKDGFTFSGGYVYYGAYWASNDVITVQAPDGIVMTSIQITDHSDWRSSNISADSGSMSNSYGSHTWTGSADGANQVVFTNSGNSWAPKTVVITYKEDAPASDIDYTVNFTGTVPDGCSVTLDGHNFTANDTYSVAKNLKKEDLVINSTADYYADVDYDATNHTYTVEFKHWYTYNFVVSIPTYNPNAAVYGGDGYYQNGESRQTKTALEESTFFAYDLNGYDENVAVTGSDYTYTVTATYTESAPIDYTIIIPEEPAGISVTVNDAIYYNAPGTYHYSTRLTLAANKFVVAAPSGYYPASAYSCYDEETHTFTASVIEYLHYNVVVEGTTDANAGVVYNYTTYHNGETIDSDYELYASYVTPANVAGLEGEVVLNDKTFTVTYTKPEYIMLTFDSSGSASNDVVSATYGTYSGMANLYSNYAPIVITSSGDPIEKIEYILNTNYSYTSYGYTSFNVGKWETDYRVWVCDGTPANSVTLSCTSGDLLYSGAKVYLKAQEPVDAPEFPLEGVAYEIKNANRGRFLTLQSSATYAAVLNSTKEEIYFTWDEMKAGFTITDADGNYMGTAENAWNIGSTTPEYWTVEDLGNGTYAFHCAQGYLGFDSGDNGFRNKGADNDYAFTITPILKGNELGVDTDGNYWTTFSNVKPTLLPEEYTPYIVTGADETLTLVAIEDHIVPANTGVLVMSEEPAVDGVAYEVLTANTTSTTDVSENLLRAGDGTYWDNESNYYYMFSLNGTDDEGSVGFYWAIEGGHGVMTKLNKAYLVLDATANVRGFRLDGKADATEGIFNALNGQEEAGAMFNLNGQRVNGKPAAGVYVKNGRKLIVK